MSDLVTDLTDYARAGLGPIPVAARAVDLGRQVGQKRGGVALDAGHLHGEEAAVDDECRRTVHVRQ